MVLWIERIHGRGSGCTLYLVLFHLSPCTVGCVIDYSIIICIVFCYWLLLSVDACVVIIFFVLCYCYCCCLLCICECFGWYHILLLWMLVSCVVVTIALALAVSMSTWTSNCTSHCFESLRTFQFLLQTIICRKCMGWTGLFFRRTVKKVTMNSTK
jgi:hypothetical protein